MTLKGSWAWEPLGGTCAVCLPPTLRWPLFALHTWVGLPTQRVDGSPAHRLGEPPKQQRAERGGRREAGHHIASELDAQDAGDVGLQEAQVLSAGPPPSRLRPKAAPCAEDNGPVTGHAPVAWNLHQAQHRTVTLVLVGTPLQGHN